MTVIRNRADARWLPSRFDFALFRLFAYFRLKAMKPEPQPNIALSVDRHQNAVENYLLPACVVVVIAAFLASIMATAIPFGAACAIALPAAVLMIDIHVVLMGVAITPLVRKVTGTRSDSGIAVSSAIVTAAAFASAVLLAAGRSPLRHVGTTYLALLAANALAFPVVLLLRPRIADLERSYGVEP